MSHPEQDFLDAIAASGITPPDTIIADGSIHRFSTNGKPRDDSGWYVLHLDGVPAGSFGCWRKGFTQDWCAKSQSSMTAAERQTHSDHIKAMHAQREADLAQRHQMAAVEAAQRLSNSTPCTEHPYLRRKGVQAHGIRQLDNNLLIPMRDSSGTLHSTQTISADGSKRYQTGGRVKGCYFAIGKPNGLLTICEGFATGASIHECTGHAVAVAFDVGNMERVARILRDKYPDLKIVIAADDDYLTEGNPGMTIGRAVAIAILGWLAIPAFPGTRGEKDKDFNDLCTLAGAAAVKACIDAAVEMNTTEIDLEPWTAPAEILSELPPAPPFDAHVLLPKVLADFVLDEASRMPCSPDYIAAALLVTLGSVIGAKCGLKPKLRDDWIVVPNLWGGIVGDPSSKKSPALSTVTRFLDRLETREAEKQSDAKSIYCAELAAFEAHQTAIKNDMKKAASGAKPDHLKMTASIANMQDLQPPQEPNTLRYKSNDSTVEKLGDILSRNPQGIMVFRDELTGLLSSWEREGHEGDRAFYLESWNGTGSFNIDRIGRGEQFVKNLCLSILGGIQPDKIEAYLAGIASSLDNDGRVQRFQVLVYPNPVDWQWIDRYPVKGAREAVRDVIDRLAVFDPVLDGATPADDFVKLPHFQFEPEAQEVYIEWCANLNLDLIVKEQDPLMKQHLGKYEKLFCSIALILHLSQGSIGHIKIESALRAAAWCEYLAAHARRIYSMVEGAKMTTARVLSHRIAQGKLKDGFTQRDVLRKHWAGLTRTLQTESALAILEEHHLVRSQESLNLQGRTTTRYAINPAILGAMSC